MYLSTNKSKSRSLDEDRHDEIIIPQPNQLYNENDFTITKNQNRHLKCSTSSSIDSGNSTSSLESNNQLNSNQLTDKQQNNLIIGQSTFHNHPSSSSSQLSSGYSTLQSKTDLDKMNQSQSNQFSEQDINLGFSEKRHVKPTDFEFLKVIGQGSYGKVLLARHKEEQKVYAVKVLQKKMILKSKEETHIMCERNVLLKNLNHPFLVGLHYSFQTRDKLYFILEFVPGGEVNHFFQFLF